MSRYVKQPGARFKCVRCGKITAGCVPRDHKTREQGDGSERFPRRHKQADGQACPGVYEFAEWVRL